MSHATFQLSETNPNDTTGGGGCLCSENHTSDTKGPYIVCYGVDMDSSVSPYVVVCRECLKELNRAAGNEQLQVGIRGDEPGISNPYHGDADQGDEVLTQRRVRAENGVLLSGVEHPVEGRDPDEDPVDDLEDDDEPLEI